MIPINSFATIKINNDIVKSIDGIPLVVKVIGYWEDLAVCRIMGAKSAYPIYGFRGITISETLIYPDNLVEIK